MEQERNSYQLDLIRKYCNDSPGDYGLWIADGPTGFGKTHNVLMYLYSQIAEHPEDERKYFFITPMKKNLPFEKLKAIFAEHGKAALYDQKVLVADANSESVMRKLPEVIDQIPSSLKEDPAFKSLRNDIAFMEMRKKGGGISLDLNQIEQVFQVNDEPAFRKMIARWLERAYARPQDRYQAIICDPKWKWISKLYPAETIREKQVIFLSMDKFLSVGPSIIEPVSLLYLSEFIKGSVIFMDEFDAAKDIMVRRIIADELRNRLDCIDMFNRISGAMNPELFPSMMLESSKQRSQGKYAGKSLKDSIETLRKMADSIQKRFNTGYQIKADADLSDVEQAFLFHDFRSITINDGGISIALDKSKRQNMIRMLKTPPRDHAHDLRYLLGSVLGFIGYAEKVFASLAQNYQENRNEALQRAAGDNDTAEQVHSIDDFSYENAVNSVLTLFKLTSEQKRFLTAQILMLHRCRWNSAKENNTDDLTFYERGFRYYILGDDPDHDMTTDINMLSFRNSAEKILLTICGTAKVIGLSATATVPTVLGNYDLDYLKSRLQDTFHTIADEDRATLKKEYEDNTAGYRDIHITAELIRSMDENGQYTINLWKQVYPDPEDAECIHNLIKQRVNDEDYLAARYLRIAAAYRKYVDHEDIHSFLCLLTKFPKQNDSKLDLDVLGQLFTWIRGNAGKPLTGTEGDVVVLPSGSDYETALNDIRERLGRGEKIFVISTYQTLGTGQNMQYPIPEDLKGRMIHTNCYPEDSDKDFDAIYLDRPTNQITNVQGDEWRDSDRDPAERIGLLAQNIFQLEALQENGTLSAGSVRRVIRWAFQRARGQGKKFSVRKELKDIYGSRDLKASVYKTLLQAVGRLCRTNMKNPDIYIFADASITDNVYLEAAEDEKRLLPPEFKALISLLRQSATKDDAGDGVETRLMNMANLQSIHGKQMITAYLEDQWTSQRIQGWKRLRLQLLQKPTVSADEMARNTAYRNLYVPVNGKGNRIWFQQDNDFDDIEFSFTKKRGFSEVSEDSARLTVLMKVPELHRLFEENGFAVSFDENDYILSPVMFQNIYKGALGEVVGKYILEKYYGLVLEEITDPEVFELFDYQIKGTSVYVDFKHWSESTYFSDEEMLKKIAEKAGRCGAECILAVNLMAANQFPSSRSLMEGIRIIEIPNLLQMEKGTVTLKCWNQIREEIHAYTN
ncbi:MAG: hypothetical protein MR488_10940 [Lachnospiraceae bacterium]|nr:hypothetical protein [Lachnospiraceae bacterium]